MIKIQLSLESIEKIKDIYWKDMKTQATGLVEVLKTQDARDFLKGKKQYTQLYKYFYHKNGKPNRENLKKLLLADKQQMEKYIDKFGKFSDGDSRELCEKVFRYDTFSGRKTAYDILKIQKVTVCPYCNRQYIFTLSNHKVRPQFDHYYPKSIYPYLAVSIFNLIPSCSICNQAKSNLDTHDKPILYPYEEEFGDEVRFRISSDDIKYLHGMTEEFDLWLEKAGVSNDKIKKVDEQIDTFHLSELYNEHKDYIKDIAWNHYINSEERIDEIMRVFPQLFRTREDAMAILYMNDIRKENLGKRPLAKLTRDIYRELNIIKDTL